MPWGNVEALPPNLKAAVKKLPAKKQRQWLAVVNKCLRAGGEEGSCIRQAWGAVRKSSNEVTENAAMALTHNSTVADSEPAWGAVDKTKLPRNAHAHLGEAGKKGTWKFAHHGVEGGKVGDEGVYVSGAMYLSRGGLNAAWQAAQGARSGSEADPGVKSHLSGHRKDIGMDTAEHQYVPCAREVGEDAPEWIELACCGYWAGHPTTEQVITLEKLQSAYDYFQRHYAAHEAKLVVDYHHGSIRAGKATGLPNAPAAGWVDQMELREDGAQLWGHVQWNAHAAQAIGKREYAYLSPVFLFNAPDRLTGEPVPLFIHSVALTNTPFMTELQALTNEALAAVGQGSITDQAVEDINMSILEALCAALDREADEVAAGLSIASDADDQAVAKAIADAVAGAKKAQDLEAQLAMKEVAPVSANVANALGVSADAEEKRVVAQIFQLRDAAGYESERMREHLGLANDAEFSEVLAMINSLKQSKRSIEAEAMVDRAIEEGRVRPAHRDIWLNHALSDPDATAQALTDMAPKIEPPKIDPVTVENVRPLNEKEKAFANQMGIKHEDLAKRLTEQGVIMS